MPALEPLITEYTSRRIGSLFVYVREAHPGENCPAVRTVEQKLAHARIFHERHDLRRPILVDDLVSTGHRFYGSLPNMVYLINRAGRIIFRADWTDVPMIRIALDYVLASRAQRREGSRLFPYYAEFAGYRRYDIEGFTAGLEFAGQQAVDDFDKAMQRWSKKKTGAPGKVVLYED